jgi:hypothetical protein
MKFKDWEIEAPLIDKKKGFTLLATADQAIFQHNGANRIIIEDNSDNLTIHTNHEPCQIQISKTSKIIKLLLTKEV